MRRARQRAPCARSQQPGAGWLFQEDGPAGSPRSRLGDPVLRAGCHSHPAWGTPCPPGGEKAVWPVVSGRLGAPRAAGPVSVAGAWVQLLSPASAGPAGQFWVVAVDSGFFFQDLNFLRPISWYFFLLEMGE